MKKYAKLFWEIRYDVLKTVAIVGGVLLLMNTCGANFD